MPKNGIKSKSHVAESSWLAGIIDGEGYISFLPIRHRNQHLCRLIITNTDEAILNEIKRILDKWLVFYSCSAVKLKVNRKQAYNIEVNRQVEVSFVLEQVLPFLKSVKREKVKLIRDYMTQPDILGRAKNTRGKRNIQFGLVI